MEIGLSLEEQLRDDPKNAEKSDAELKKVAKDYMKKYILPLKCIDRYLKALNREGQYKIISSGMTDREGRWQAFTDYSNTYYGIFGKPNRMIEFNIEEDDVEHILRTGRIIERYDEDFPLPSLLLNGRGAERRPLHVVVGINIPERELIVITAYEPDPLKWVRDFSGRRK